MKICVSKIVSNLLLSIALVTLSTNASADKKNPDLRNFVAEGNFKFNTELTRKPEKVFETTLSFNREIGIDEAIRVVFPNNRGKDGKSKVKIKAFFHANEDAESTGAYIIPEGDSLDTTVDRYLRQKIFMYETRIQLVRNQLSDELSEPMRIELEKMLATTLQGYDDLNISGLKVIGVRLEGRGKSLKSFKKVNRRLIRASLISEPDFYESAIAPWEQ